jgi:hypothetical protein
MEREWAAKYPGEWSEWFDFPQFLSEVGIFADALEDAGCDNADIFSHGRGPGPHVRGCWVVDLLLGKG